jgi:hypothetical protein
VAPRRIIKGRILTDPTRLSAPGVRNLSSRVIWQRPVQSNWLQVKRFRWIDMMILGAPVVKLDFDAFFDIIYLTIYHSYGSLGRIAKKSSRHGRRWAKAEGEEKLE